MKIAGVSRDRTPGFIRIRAVKANKLQLEANRLEKRVEKLTKAYSGEFVHQAAPQPANILTLFNPMASNQSLEKSVVSWEPDNSANHCSVCMEAFNFIQRRRHHCRLCGKLVCGKCSNMKHVTQVEVRVCETCSDILALRTSWKDEPPSRLTDIYQKSNHVKTVIQDVLPKFNDLLLDLRSRQNLSIDDQNYQLALKYRKNLLDLFNELEGIGKVVKALGNRNANKSTRKLHDNIHIAIIQYLHENMLTLQLMPSTMEQQATNATKSENVVFKSAQDEVVYLQHQQTVLVLDEQRRQIETSLVDATSRRRLEDAMALRENLNELQIEIENIKQQMELLRK